MTTSPGEPPPGSDAANDEAARIRLDTLKREHRALDERIKLLLTSAQTDVFEVQRLKKQKLQLKDEIAKIEDIVNPDIIA